MSESESERYAKGMRKFRALHPQGAEMISQALGDVAPDQARFLAEFLFHDLYTREGLDPRLRQTATLAALVTQGAKDFQLKMDVEIARRMGFSRGEIVEIFMQLSAYAGFPLANNALIVAKQAFDGEGAE